MKLSAFGLASLVVIICVMGIFVIIATMPMPPPSITMQGSIISQKADGFWVDDGYHDVVQLSNGSIVTAFDSCALPYAFNYGTNNVTFGYFPKWHDWEQLTVVCV